MVTQEYAIAQAKSFVADCTAHGVRFDKVMLFGSFARNEIREHSDIDLLLISKQFSDNVFENLKLYSKINIKYPIIETHPYPTSHYLNGDDFIKEIEKEAIEIQ